MNLTPSQRQQIAEAAAMIHAEARGGFIPTLAEFVAVALFLGMLLIWAAILGQP